MSRNQVGILITLLLGVFMGALDIFIVAPALRPLQAGLHVSARDVTWSFTAYTLVLVVTQPFIAKCADRYGRRWIYVSCVALFGIGSATCALSSSFAPFLVGRCIQALGVGGILPVASAVIADTFPESRRGMALGIVTSFFGVAFIVGPIVGSILTGGVHIGSLTTDWHAIFVVNLPLAVLIAVLALRYLPLRSPGRSAPAPFDVYGAALLAAALFFLVLGLTQLDFTALAPNFTNPAAIPSVLVGLACFAPFWLNEQRTQDPIILPRILTRRQILITMSLSVTAGIITSSIVYIPQLAEAELRLPRAGEGGIYLVWVALALTIGTMLVGRMIDRVGSRTMLLTGGVVSGVALALLLTIGNTDGGLKLALVLIGLGLSTFSGTPLRYIILNEAPADRRAATLSVLTICNSLGQSIILPLAGAIIASAGITAESERTPPAAVGALHSFFLLVFAFCIIATIAALGLKKQAQEQADIRRRIRRVTRDTATAAPATTTGTQTAAMSTR